MRNEFTSWQISHAIYTFDATFNTFRMGRYNPAVGDLPLFPFDLEELISCSITRWVQTWRRLSRSPQPDVEMRFLSISTIRTMDAGMPGFVLPLVGGRPGWRQPWLHGERANQCEGETVGQSIAEAA